MMSEGREFVLAGGGRSLRLAVREADLFSGEPVFPVQLSVDAGPFAGAFQICLAHTDLPALRGTLELIYKAYPARGSARFKTFPQRFESQEHNLEITLTAHRDGQVDAAVAVTPGSEYDPLLRFGIPLDQSDLPGLIAQLNALLRQKTPT